MAVCSRGRVSLVRSPTTRCFNPSLTLMRDYLDGNLRSSAVGCSSAPLSVLRNLSASAAKETDIHAWENEYADLKVNWFPGHMVKATNAIREKLKHVDMVFEIRDARVPFSSANPELDRLVGPNKARLIILNKSDLANPRLQQPVLERFEAEGKAAIFACGKSGTNINKLLAWAKAQGAKRGGFSTTGSVAMVVGMPNVGKSSLINLLRGKATGGPGGVGENAKQVARVGATPGVTRHVSAFCIATKPPLYLVDTPGVMVPKVDMATMGLRLALIRAVPDAVVPPDVLVGFMLRIVRARRPLRRSQRGRPLNSKVKAITTKQAAALEEARVSSETGMVEYEEEPDDEDADEVAAFTPIETWLRYGGMRPESATPTHAETEVKNEYRTERDWWEEETDALLLQVQQESGAEGKPEEDARRRICCRYLLDAFWAGKFGKITLDNVLLESTPPASFVEDKQEKRVKSKGSGTRAKGTQGWAKEKRRREWLAPNLDRDWSSPSAWEVSEKAS